MKSRRFSFFLLPLLAATAVPASAQDVGRVSPASLPLPLPASSPLPPDQLRAHNPWNLAMTGAWKFKLTYGQIIAGQFHLAAPPQTALSASTAQTENPSQNAFDGTNGTRWCATGPTYPQWLQADLGKTQRVSGANLTWEYGDDRYQYKIEGRAKSTAPWKTLSDRTTGAGFGDGAVPVTPADVRYVRITVTGTSGAHWASLREFQIQTTQNGRTVAWKPPVINPATTSVAVRDAFTQPGYNDAKWDTQTVPFNWEMLGYSLPTYDAVDTTVGLYRRTVAVPAAWAGKRIYWHFDGSLDGTEIFINGKKAGYHESGYTGFDVDLTGLVKPGERNLFAARVSKSTPSSDCETGDFQAMGGIYRDTSLIAVPQTHVADITVRTPLAPNYKDATLESQLTVAGVPGQTVAVTGKLMHSNGRSAGVSLSGKGVVQAGGTVIVAMSAPVAAPALWSAEKPNLYYVVFSVAANGKPVENVQERFGFKQIEVKNDIVLWNGMPIKCTGVCRHDFWADKGFALTEANWVKDLNMMKAANINAVRTSHYNHAQRFLELCDEKGMYILDEVPYCWINDQVKDPAYTPFLLQRGRETVARDKNRPCVLAWSLGNENPTGQDSQETLNLVRQMDPTRPAFVSGQDPESMKGQLWKDDHYPGPDSVDRYAANTRWGTNLTEHPHTFFEKNVLDYDPGAHDVWSETLIKTWGKLWKAPNILGSFIWEWQSQGIADKNADTTTDFYYGPGYLRQENNKGIVSAYRVPKPELWIVKTVYSPVVVDTRTVSPAGGVCAVPITNHYSFTNLSELTCRWTAMSGVMKLKSGVLPLNCGPMQSVTATVPAPAGTTAVRLEFLHPDGSSVIAYNLAVAGVPLPAAPPALTAGAALTTQNDAGTLTVTNALQQLVFNKQTGAIQTWRVRGQDRLSGGPQLNLGEGKIEDDRDFYAAKQPSVLTGAQVSAAPGASGAVRVTVTGTAQAAAGGPALGMLTTTYDVMPDAQMTVGWTLNWTAADTLLWEQGMTLAVPTSLNRMTWQRDSYFTDYPAGHIGEPSGTAGPDDLLFRASKRGLHWLTLTDSMGRGLALMPSADTPLVGRADAAADGTTLFASREVAADTGLSGSWVSEHVTHAVKGKSLSGTFTLRAIDAPGLTARK